MEPTNRRSLRRQTDIETLPIRNVPMQLLMDGHGGDCSCHAIDSWDDEPTQEGESLTLHQQEAIAALYRYRAMRGAKRGLTRLAWHAIGVRLSDARMQLTVGMSPAEALAAPLVADLLSAQLAAGHEKNACGSTAPMPRRLTRELVSRGRVLIQIVHV
jgi:hypothetical protein